MNDFLKAEPVPAYLAASFRTFSPGEFHVTRNAPYSVLLLLMKGTLRFEEDGISVEVKAGEYYIQRAGLTQHARQPSDMPHYFYIHFSGAYGTAADGSIPLRGGWNPQPLETVLQELDRLERLSLGRAFGKQALFFEVLDQLSRGLKNESGNEDLVRRTRGLPLGPFSGAGEDGEPGGGAELFQGLPHPQLSTRQGYDAAPLPDDAAHRPCEVDAGEYRVLRAGNRRGLRLRRPLRFQPCLSCPNGAYAYPVAEGKPLTASPADMRRHVLLGTSCSPARGGRSFSLRRALLCPGGIFP